MGEYFKGLSVLVKLLLSLGLIALVVSLVLLLYWNQTSPCRNWIHSELLAPQCREYWKAVQDASVPESNEISDRLTAVSKTDESLAWKGEPPHEQLLVVTWLSENELRKFEDEEGTPRLIEGEHWVTAVPELKTVCRRLDPECRDSADLTLRLEKLLGLPPESHKTHFVEFWVSPDDLFRPCPDPEISDAVCEVGSPTTTNPDHIKWFNCLRWRNYGWPFQLSGYPWTQLGYTYDWGNPQSEIGLSEFVVKDESGVKDESISKDETPREVHRIAATREYLK